MQAGNKPEGRHSEYDLVLKRHQLLFQVVPGFNKRFPGADMLSHHQGLF